MWVTWTYQEILRQPGKSLGERAKGRGGEEEGRKGVDSQGKGFVLPAKIGTVSQQLVMHHFRSVYFGA